MTDIKPTIYLASDHAGFGLKNELAVFLQTELGYSVVDCGASTLDLNDDYPDFIAAVARAVGEDPRTRLGIVLGGSGQGEAIAANRFNGVRAVVYYGASNAQTDAEGKKIDIVASTREHNDANVLSLGARFISSTEARAVVQQWLGTEFGGNERHKRRIAKLEKLTS